MTSEEVTGKCRIGNAYKINDRLYTYAYDVAAEYDGGLDDIIQVVDVECAADIAYGSSDLVDAGNVGTQVRDSLYEGNARVITRVIGAASAGNAIFTESCAICYFSTPDGDAAWVCTGTGQTICAVDAVLASFILFAGAFYVAKYDIASVTHSAIAMQLRSDRQINNNVRRDLFVDDPIEHEKEIIRSAIFNATGIDLHSYNQSHPAVFNMFNKDIEVFPNRDSNGTVSHYITKYDDTPLEQAWFVPLARQRQQTTICDPEYAIADRMRSGTG